VGDGDPGIGLPTEREPPATTIVRGLEDDEEKTAARDFRITAAHHIGEGSLRGKALANIEAIRTLKLIEIENRDATEAEKSILVRYAGWGAMARALRPCPPQEWQSVAGQSRGRRHCSENNSALGIDQRASTRCVNRRLSTTVWVSTG